jgi:hypothetical protein
MKLRTVAIILGAFMMTGCSTSSPPSAEYKRAYDAEVKRIQDQLQTTEATGPLTVAELNRRYPVQVPAGALTVPGGNHDEIEFSTPFDPNGDQSVYPTFSTVPSTLPPGSYATYSDAWRARQAYRAQRNGMLDAATEQVTRGGNASALIPITSAGRPVYDPSTGSWRVPLTPGARSDDRLNQPYYGR